MMLRILKALCSIIGVTSFQILSKKSIRTISPILDSNFSDVDKLNYLELIKRNIKPGSIVTIKYGGHAMENDELKKFFCEDIASLCEIGVYPVIVHGGGPQIAKMLKDLNIVSEFVQGLRVTDDKTMEVAQMVLCGLINKDIVAIISKYSKESGAIGLSGLDSKLIQATIIKKTIKGEDGVEQQVDLGRVGYPDPSRVNVHLIKSLLGIKLVPVIAPVGYDADTGKSLNINADTAAGAVAQALQAERLLLLTDIVGVLNKDKHLIDTVLSSELEGLIADGTITGGMIPKLETATEAVNGGVGAVSIMDGRVRHCVLRALSGEVFGTIVKKG